MIGLGTYSFFWQHSERAPEPLSLPAMLHRTRDLGVGVFQICDYLPILGYSAAELAALRSLADELGIGIELGTRGVGQEHLATFLHLADVLGATVVRSMVNTAEHRPSMGEAEALLRASLPSYADAGVTLALETYEQVRTADLVGLVEAVGSPSLGICLDPANTVAALELPRDVVERTAPYVANVHVKDFAFTRRDGWVGFTLEGAALGTGLLDYDHLVATVQPEARGVNQIIEHWLPWQGSFDETSRLENLWNEQNIAYLRSKQ
ncbi:MAG: sugar phosphate isomerase [Micrococcales bacterium 70-64]|nr:sugar phosphate isomerase/epimerase [Leifsonia sp.]ODU63587.1 MAG: sugar phosphate isomerase [Leifsonia sp. SCN 70-46]OJX85278.1 MAG: sugar phosphate isomerase [Micrococcales bacterium 70-64]